MAGRGRGATLPAWMTSGVTAAPETGPSIEGQFADKNDRHDDRQDDRKNKKSRSRSRSRDRGDRRDRDRDRDRRDRERDRDRDRRDKDRGSDRDRRRRSPSPNVKWVPRKKKGLPSNFDVRPPNGIELPPIGVHNPVNGIPNSFLSFSNNPLAMLQEPSSAPPSVQQRLQQQHHSNYQQKNDASITTRHARRLYAGGIPNVVTEMEVKNYFNEVVTRALHPAKLDSLPVVGVYLNLEKSYAFVELPSIELATACMQLDGIRWDHPTGSVTLRVRRPNDYHPELVPTNLGPIPQLNMDYLMTMGVASPDGPGKIFVGGLPYNLGDESIVELLSAFGQVKVFNQVREPGSAASKGYAFCEYYTKEVSDAAIAGLNGMPLGDKTLTVRYANNGPSAPTNTHMASQQFQYPAPVVNTLQSSAPTRVLKLSNMVSHEDLENDAEYEDIKEDVRLECMDHGQVLSVVIPRAKDGFPAASEGHIFVEFTNPANAKNAATALNGRKFGSKTVIVQYYDESHYASRMFM